MADENREMQDEPAPLLLPWGRPSSEAQDAAAGALGLWLTGGASLLLWTGIAVLLTSA